jgi:hypothetical protein
MAAAAATSGETKQPHQRHCVVYHGYHKTRSCSVPCAFLHENTTTAVRAAADRWVEMQKKRKALLAARASIQCKFFLDGGCKKGDDCQYLHPEPEPEPESEEETKGRPCRFYAKGHCRKGDACDFTHDDPMDDDDDDTVRVPDVMASPAVPVERGEAVELKRRKAFEVKLRHQVQSERLEQQKKIMRATVVYDAVSGAVVGGPFVLFCDMLDCRNKVRYYVRGRCNRCSDHIREMDAYLDGRL